MVRCIFLTTSKERFGKLFIKGRAMTTCPFVFHTVSVNLCVLRLCHEVRLIALQALLEMMEIDCANYWPIGCVVQARQSNHPRLLMLQDKGGEQLGKSF